MGSIFTIIPKMAATLKKIDTLAPGVMQMSSHLEAFFYGPPALRFCIHAEPGSGGNRQHQTLDEVRSCGWARAMESRTFSHYPHSSYDHPSLRVDRHVQSEMKNICSLNISIEGPAGGMTISLA
ncbi:hypothetical protein NDU88_000263 [Pleurodeles waltl]|uniref:Uncharacterized protein n=1 Tax=Pleurodeles waltl TaxID=8319 RepID=A0AAV7S6K4_PLEWA|nr:hypothetical protein NDU88_000263 [Pleurodeles waltl]